MGTSRLSSVAARAVAALPLLVALSGCATPGGARLGKAGPTTEDAGRGPRVQIWTTSEIPSGDRVRTSFRLDDDAYVVVVNVGRDGYASVIFPESPDDDGFMRGGRTYRLPAFFPGFASDVRSQYGRLYAATSAYDDIYDRYAGYVFVIASWRPMHFEMAEALGLWDDYRLAAHEERLEPYAVMHRFASAFAFGQSRDFTARFARYAAFGGGFAGRRSFANCSLYGSVFGYMPLWAFQTLGGAWLPSYGIDYYGNRRGCGYGSFRLAGARPVGPVVVRPPAVPRDSADTAWKPQHPRPPRTPVADSDSGQRRRPRGRRADVALEEHPIIDVTRENRRRDRETDRTRRGMRDGRGYDAPDDWRRRRDRMRETERSDVATERSDVAREVDRSERRARTPVDHDSRARDDSRRSEPRREEPSRSTPRSEPRQDTRPQPAARSDPPSRSEPAPRAEPRSERPPKPERQ